VLSLARARAHAVVVIVIFGAVWGFGVLRRHGMIDGFGHVIGGDLVAVRSAARIVRDGRGAELYDFSLQGAYEQAAVAPEPLPGVNPFVSPPFFAVACLPLAFLPVVPALVLWTVLLLGCLVATLIVMSRLAPRTGASWPSTLLLSLSFYPVLEGLIAGSNSFLSLPLFALMLRSLRAGREVPAGMLLGLQLYRPQLALAPLLVFAVKRRWRILAGFAAVGFAWMLLTLVVGPHALVDWLALAPQLSRMIFEPGMPSALFASVYALFLLPLGPEHFRLGMAAGTLVSLVLLGILLRLWAGPWERDPARLDLRFAALLVVTPLVSQYLQLHDFALLILPALLVAEHALEQGTPAEWRLVSVVLVVLWLACLVGPPIITRVVPLPVAPLAALLFGWVVLRACRRATGAPPA
jgi:glycosyl transferase family 87